MRALLGIDLYAIGCRIASGQSRRIFDFLASILHFDNFTFISDCRSHGRQYYQVT